MAGSMYVGSQFNPISYQEMLAPVQQATEAHRDVEDQQAQLDTLSEQWANKLNNTDDADLKQQYQGYLTKLQDASNNLMVNGLTPITRQQLGQLKAGYSNTIVPIETAYKDRQVAATELNKLKMQDPTLMNDVDLGQVALSKFIANPNYTTPTYSGTLLAKQTVDALSPLAQKLANNPHLRTENPDYYRYVEHYGATTGMIKAYLDGNIQGPIMQTVKGEIDKIIQSSGMTNWGSWDKQKDRAMGYINSELTHAIGPDKVGFEKDPKGEFNRQRQLQIEQDKGNMPTILTHMGIDTTVGKEIQGLKNKLYDKDGSALSQAWGSKAQSNPLKLYEDYKEWQKNGLSNYNKTVDEIQKNNILPGVHVGIRVNPSDHKQMHVLLDKYGNEAKLPANIQKQIDTNNGKYNYMSGNNQFLTDDEANHLRNAGYTRNTDFRTGRNLLNDYQDVQQKLYNTNEVKLTDSGYKNTNQDITNDLLQGNGRLIKVNNRFNTSNNETASVKDWEKGYNKDKGSNLSRIESDPNNKGLIVTNQNGDMFKWVPSNVILKKNIENTYDDNNGIGALIKVANSPKYNMKTRKAAALRAGELNSSFTHDNLAKFFTGADTYTEYPETGRGGGQGFEK